MLLGRQQHKSFGGAANPCEGLGMHCIILFLVLSMSVADADAAAGVRCAIVCSVYLCVVIEHGPAPCQLLLREVGLSLDGAMLSSFLCLRLPLFLLADSYTKQHVPHFAEATPGDRKSVV